uniref:Uncharacterized protein n=1 Tax=Anguilla anguilla TaxID=7936 RepID=A0A0E9S9E1_ANGAN
MAGEQCRQGHANANEIA